VKEGTAQRKPVEGEKGVPSQAPLKEGSKKKRPRGVKNRKTDPAGGGEHQQISERERERGGGSGQSEKKKREPPGTQNRNLEWGKKRKTVQEGKRVWEPDNLASRRRKTKRKEGEASVNIGQRVERAK